MDITGVDVDSLRDEEILELCGNIVDLDSEEISVLNGVNVNNLSTDKVQELYDDVISINDTPVQYVQEFKGVNNDIADDNPDEIMLINGYNVNFENLSDDEILAFYDDIIDNGDLLAYDTTTYTCSVKNPTYKLYDSSVYGSYRGAYAICKSTYGYDTFEVFCASQYADASSCKVLAIARNSSNGACYFKCLSYNHAVIYCYAKGMGSSEFYNKFTYLCK